MKRRGDWGSRALLALLAVVALAFGALWWLVTGLAAGSHDSACMGELAAEIAFGVMYGALAAALVALVAGLSGDTRVAWWSLAAYVALFAVSLPLFLGCA